MLEIIEECTRLTRVVVQHCNVSERLNRYKCVSFYIEGNESEGSGRGTSGEYASGDDDDEEDEDEGNFEYDNDSDDKNYDDY